MWWMWLVASCCHECVLTCRDGGDGDETIINRI